MAKQLTVADLKQFIAKLEEHPKGSAVTDLYPLFIYTGATGYMPCVAIELPYLMGIVLEAN